MSLDRRLVTSYVLVAASAFLSILMSSSRSAFAGSPEPLNCSLIQNFASGCNCSVSSTNFVQCSGKTFTWKSSISSLINESLGIEILKITDSQIDRIASNELLTSSTNLRVLHLDLDGIRSIDTGAFSRLGSLDILSLENNRLRVLDPGTFSGLERLTVLNLAGNELYIVDVNLFSLSDTPQLVTLDLSRCRINDFQMDGLPHLQVIYLQNNRLISFPEFGTDLGNLTTVDVSGNRIRSLDGVRLPSPGPISLHLRDNEISKLSNVSIFSYFTSEYRITELDLRNNKINEIETGSLSGLTRLTDLDLSSNQLTSINKAALPWSTLRKVIVHDNPWDCTTAADKVGLRSATYKICTNAWLLEKVVATWNNESVVKCASPASAIAKNIYHDKVLNPCNEERSTNGHTVAGLIVALIILVCVSAAICTVLIVARRRWRRDHHPVDSQTPTAGHRRRGMLSSVINRFKSGSELSADRSVSDLWSPSSVGYRQMDDFNAGSVTEDHDEL